MSDSDSLSPAVSSAACVALLRNSERLLEHAEALARENAELRLCLEQSEASRGSLEKRLAAARARVEALIDRLPANRGDAVISTEHMS